MDECWRRIGVGGDGTCPELAQHVHCRNCPVYAQAGARLLNRPTPAGYRRHWAAHFAGAKPRPAGARVANPSATLFRLGPEWLALDTVLFQEVAEHRPMHSLPHRRMGVVLGLVNVRGELLLCISLGRLLGVNAEGGKQNAETAFGGAGEASSSFSIQPSAFPREGYRRLLVVSADTNRFAFPVDEVHGVHRFNREELEEPPATVARAARSFTRGVFRWRQHTVGYLDSEALFLNLHRSLT